MVKSYRKGEMLLELFKLLKDAPEGLKPKDAIEKLSATMELTDYEKGDFSSGGRRFDKIVRFNTIDAAKAGYLIKNGSCWIITESGLEALKNFTSPDLMQKNVQKMYQKWKQGGDQSHEIEADEDADLVKSTRVTYEEAQEQAQESIDEFLGKMNPYEFQDLIADLLEAMEYHVIWVSPPGKDGGTDILAYTDPLGIQGPRIKVQVKRQQNTVSEPELKSFVANIGPHDSGIYFCTGGFSLDAHKYARQQENKRIMLVDSKTLVKLWINNMRKLSDQAWQRLPLTPIYFLTPVNE